jgi:hypothetical protein
VTERPPTHADAELMLRLYELRREPEMRKARNWAMFDFSPQSVADVMSIAGSPKTEQNHWLRQVAGYWEMACSFVNRGILDRELFVENSGEMLNFWVKMKPILPELRAQSGFPVLANMEQVVTSSERARDWAARLEKAFAQRTAAAAERK